MRKRSWAYYSPEFECDKFNTEMMKYSPWSGHRAFAYDWVANFKPGKIVELGSYYGCSAFSFLQAIKDLELDTEFFGIDTWSGDDFTTVDYQEDIYGAYKKVQDTCFADQHAYMLRMTFDEAVSSFEDASIDLLHIDGSHKYEDVKHDFYTWKDKVKNTGIILFHDVSDDRLFGKVMGSHIFWEEVKKGFPYTIEFPFSFGLGVLFFDKTNYETFKENISLIHYQKLVNRNDVLNKDVIRKYYFERRDLQKYVKSLERQVQISQTHLSDYEKNVFEKGAYIHQLEEKLEQLTCECRDTYTKSQAAIKEYERDIATIKNGISEKDSYIEELKLAIERYDSDQKKQVAYIEELMAGIQKYADDEKAKQEYIGQLENTIRELNEAITNYQKEIETVSTFLEGQKQDYKNALQDKERYINELELAIANLNKLVAKKDEYNNELNQTIEKYRLTVEGKEAYITDLLEAIKEYQSTTEAKDRYIAELEETIQKYQSTVAGKDDYIESLKKDLQNYEATVQGKDSYIYGLEYTVKLEAEEKQKREIYISELESRIKDKTRVYKLCRCELDEIKNHYSALLRRQTEIEYQNIDLQKSIENTYEVLGRYKREMSQSIIGRHFIKRVERKNEQS